jgi:hypothetical protein
MYHKQNQKLYCTSAQLFTLGLGVVRNLDSRGGEEGGSGARGYAGGARRQWGWWISIDGDDDSHN